MDVYFYMFIFTLLFLGIAFILGLYLIFIKLTGLRLIDYFPTFKENRLKMIFSILSVILAFLINWLVMKNLSFLFEVIHPIASFGIFLTGIYFLLRFLFLKKVPLSKYEKRFVGNAIVISVILESLKISEYMGKHNIASPITVTLFFVIPVVIFLIASIVYEIRKSFKY
ncbi:hypothetical protein JH146_0593 [Methanocaldococcus bathoardescens]|uniref:Uncharacterized protein n=1 Tax=Methanocaldococcus bathoardescens TaxID=1301915 RepID=A0A076LF35_9EURY|nr:hypothetical protein [Methanocaldococcus bathoardescens]AIJ05442.1 hypothetical protein JH146_0593 [Methanocaldococcus bathoardescens]